MYTPESIYQSLEGICFGVEIDRVKFHLFEEICFFYLKYEHLEDLNAGVFLDYDVLGLAVDRAYGDYVIILKKLPVRTYAVLPLGLRYMQPCDQLHPGGNVLSTLSDHNPQLPIGLIDDQHKLQFHGQCQQVGMMLSSLPGHVLQQPLDGHHGLQFCDQCQQGGNVLPPQPFAT